LVFLFMKFMYILHYLSHFKSSFYSCTAI
jgi:hypothetical protein